ncbi:hypothetical protein BJX70DRAFT_136364 [Aspergillus crustosus]
MRSTPSKFIEILNFADTHPRISDSDVRLEDVLADHEARTLVARPISSTQNSNSSKISLDRERSAGDRASTSPSPGPGSTSTATPRSSTTTSPGQRWKRLSHILDVTRRPV